MPEPVRGDMKNNWTSRLQRMSTFGSSAWVVAIPYDAQIVLDALWDSCVGIPITFHMSPCTVCFQKCLVGILRGDKNGSKGNENKDDDDHHRNRNTFNISVLILFCYYFRRRRRAADIYALWILWWDDVSACAPSLSPQYQAFNFPYSLYSFTSSEHINFHSIFVLFLWFFNDDFNASSE